MRMLEGLVGKPLGCWQHQQQAGRATRLTAAFGKAKSPASPLCLEPRRAAAPAQGAGRRIVVELPSPPRTTICQQLQPLGTALCGTPTPFCKELNLCPAWNPTLLQSCWEGAGGFPATPLCRAHSASRGALQCHCARCL